MLWSGDSIYRYDAIRDAVDVAAPGLDITHEVAAYQGSTIGTALLEVSGETHAFIDGAWRVRSRGEPFDAYHAFVFAFMRNDASLAEGVDVYASAYEKVLEQASLSFARVISGDAPPSATPDRTAWDPEHDLAELGGYRAAVEQLALKWRPCHVEMYTMFVTLTTAGAATVAELMRDTVHPSDGAGASAIGKAVAAAMACSPGPPAVSAIPGRIVTYLFGEPTAGEWTVTAAHSESSAPSPLGRVAGLAEHFAMSSELGATVRFPPVSCAQVWVHYLLARSGGGTFTIYVDRGTPAERRRSYTTSTLGPYELHTMSRLVAADLTEGEHRIEITQTAGASTPVRLLGVTCVGSP